MFHLKTKHGRDIGRYLAGLKGLHKKSFI